MNISQVPKFETHRTVTGAPVAADGAIDSTIPYPSPADAVDFGGWVSALCLVRLTGGAAPTVILEQCHEVLHDAQIFYVVDRTTKALSDKSIILCPVHQERVYFRIKTVTGNPTRIQILLSGRRRLQDSDGTLEQLLFDETSGRLKVDANLVTGDIELGSVELKDALTDARARILAAAALTEAMDVVGVHDPSLGLIADAKVDTDAVGTLSAKLRGAVSRLAALEAHLPAGRGPQSAANGISICEPDIPPIAAGVTEQTMAAAVYTTPANVKLATLVANAVYWLELEPDPNAAGGSLSDIIWGRYAATAEPTGDTVGVLVVSGRRERICWPAGGDLFIRKHTATPYPCRWRIWRKDG